MIELASQSDTSEIRRLWDEAFPEEPLFNNWFFECRYRPDTCLVLREDGVIKAMAQQLCYELKDVGKVSYIYGAATKQEYRRQGMMRRLLNFSFDMDKKRGRAASILIPQNKPLFDFYSALGYKTAFYVHSGTFEGKADTTGFELRNASDDDIPFMDSLYTEKAGKNYILRTYEYWREQINMFRTLDGEVFILLNKGNPVGYAFYNGDFVQEIFTPYTDIMLSLMCACFGKPLKYVTVGEDTPIGMICSYGKPIEGKSYLNLMFN